MSGFTVAELDAAKAAYIANCDYDDGSGDVTKARAFKVACRKLLMMLPQMAMTFAAGGTHQIQLDTKLAQGELDKVTAWLGSNDTTLPGRNGQVRQLCPQEFR